MDLDCRQCGLSRPLDSLFLCVFCGNEISSAYEHIGNTKSQDLEALCTTGTNTAADEPLQDQMQAEDGLVDGMDLDDLQNNARNVEPANMEKKPHTADTQHCQLKEEIARLKIDNKRLLDTNEKLGTEIQEKGKELQNRDAEIIMLQTKIKTEGSIKSEDGKQLSADDTPKDQSKQTDHELIQANHELQEKISQLQKEHVDQQEKTEQDAVAMNKEIEHQVTQITKLRKDCRKLSQLTKDHSQLKQDMESRRWDYEKKRAEYRGAQIEDLEAKLAEKENDVDFKDMEIGQLEDQVKTIDEEKQAKDRHIQLLDAEIEVFREEAKDKDEHLHDTQQKLGLAQQSLNASSNELKAMKAQITILEKEDRNKEIVYLQSEVRKARQRTEWGATVEISSSDNHELDVNVKDCEGYVLEEMNKWIQSITDDFRKNFNKNLLYNGELKTSIGKRLKDSVAESPRKRKKTTISDSQTSFSSVSEVPMLKAMPSSLRRDSAIAEDMSSKVSEVSLTLLDEAAAAIAMVDESEEGIASKKVEPKRKVVVFDMSDEDYDEETQG